MMDAVAKARRLDSAMAFDRIYGDDVWDAHTLDT
jgi:hypothetical protein